MKTFRRLHIIALCSVAVLIAAMASAAEPPESADGSKPAQQRRRMTPVTTAATTTQSVNETRNDTARINAERRARSTTYINKEGRTVYVDTVSGEEWIDSLAAGRRVPPMKYPLFHSLAVGVNLWDPVMRAFGQHYGLADAWLELSIHNRYNPVVELGLGKADDTRAGQNYSYRSPMSFYFRVGADYNFLYNSDPAYQFHAGVRYGFSPFSYTVGDVTLDSPYWDESTTFSIPAQHATAGWFEFCLGLRVRLWGPISAGWNVKYQTILHESRATYGKPWYIPGYGSRSGAITGSFSIIYTIPFHRGGLNKISDDNVDKTEDLTQNQH